ncbi:MAG: hypothetical protein ACT4PZ_24620 [Panacagrimonas sp.]
MSEYKYTEGEKGLGLLHGVKDEVRTMARLMQRLGYTPDLELSNSPTFSEVDTYIHELFFKRRESPIHGDDIVVVYLTGHGFVDSGKALSLLVKDTDPHRGNHPATGITALSKHILGARADKKTGNPAQAQVLIILDTCLSGAGVFELSRLVDALRENNALKKMAVYVVAASGPYEAATTGYFASALNHVLTLRTGELRRSNREHDVPSDVLSEARKRIDARTTNQKASGRSVTDDPDAWHFFPNPCYGSRPPPNPHHFVGRSESLKNLREWLRVSDAEDRIRIVTGVSGSGKSTLLARF